jgi:hypothetical protein
MTGLAVAGTVLSVGGGLWGAWQQKKAANETARAQIKAGYAQKAQYDAEAAEQERQAQYEKIRAARADQQGREEADKRSSQLAQEIGSIYANFAGNGLLVDGNATTVGDTVLMQKREGYGDINTIRDNTKMNVWEHQMSAKSYLSSAAMARTAGANALEAAYESARATRKAAKNSFISTLIGLGGKAASGTATAVNTYDSYGWGWSKKTSAT